MSPLYSSALKALALVALLVVVSFSSTEAIKNSLARCEECIKGAVPNDGVGDLQRVKDRVRQSVLKICKAHDECPSDASFQCSCAGPGMTNCKDKCDWFDVGARHHKRA